MLNNRNKALFIESQKVMPGGVNSPVRAFTNMDREPLFIKKAEGAYIYDANGEKYLDYVSSWGPIILGHCNKIIEEAVSLQLKKGLSFGAPTALEVEMSELIIEMVPNIEMVRMVNSGTEAVMSSLRLARGYTGKKKIIKFKGCYHGHCDSMLAKAGSALLTGGIPSSSGVPEAVTKDTLIATYNDFDSVRALLNEHRNDIAAIIVEPVAANMGVILPKVGFLENLRSICNKEGALLVFDEVITGFRLGKGGAQSYYNVAADIVILGKIIGGGMPVGAYGASKEIMKGIAPLGSVYQAGTLSGNPITMTAGLAQLHILNENPHIYDKLNLLGTLLGNGMKSLGERYQMNICVNQVGSLVGLFLLKEPLNEVSDYSHVEKSDSVLFKNLFKFLLDYKINIAPSPFEAIFINNSHSEKDIKNTLGVIEMFFEKIKEEI